MNDSFDTVMTGKSGSSYGRYGAYPFQPPGASSVSENCMFQPATPRRNLERFVGILPRSRISGTDAVEAAEVGEGCATSIFGVGSQQRFFCQFSEVNRRYFAQHIMGNATKMPTSDNCYKRSGG